MKRTFIDNLVDKKLIQKLEMHINLRIEPTSDCQTLFYAALNEMSVSGMSFEWNKKNNFTYYVRYKGEAPR